MCVVRNYFRVERSKARWYDIIADLMDLQATGFSQFLAAALTPSYRIENVISFVFFLPLKDTQTLK